MIWIACLFSFNLFAAVPHTLSNGGTVDAAQLNANFAANAKRWVYKNNGVYLGEMTLNGQFISDKGFFGAVSRSNADGIIGSKTSRYFSTTDCTGTPYNYSSYGPSVFLDYSGTTYYSLSSDTPVAFAFKSGSSSTGCFSHPTNTNQTYFSPVYVNDPAITGVPNYPLSGPITLVRE